MVIDVVEAHVCPAGQMDVVDTDVDAVDVVDEVEDDGLQVKPVGQMVEVGTVVVAVDVEVDDGLQVNPVGQIVVVV